MLFEAKYVLYSILEAGPVPAKEAIRQASAAGVSRRTLMRAKHELGVDSKKRGSGKGSQWMWQPPQNQELVRQFKDRDLGDLIDELIHGQEDAPLPGDEWKTGGGKFEWTEDDDDSDDNGGLPCND